MMRHQEILRRVFEAVTQGRAREIEDLVATDMEFVSVVTGREFIGVRGIEAWHSDVCSYYDELRFEILELHDLVERDAIRWRFGGRSRATGVECDTEMSQLWSYRGDVVARVEVFPDPDGALRAAGVEPPP